MKASALRSTWNKSHKSAGYEVTYTLSAKLIEEREKAWEMDIRWASIINSMFFKAFQDMQMSWGTKFSSCTINSKCK